MERDVYKLGVREGNWGVVCEVEVEVREYLIVSEVTPHLLHEAVGQ